MAVTTRFTASSAAGTASASNPQEHETSLSPSDFFFKVFLITALCHILHYPFKKTRQPRVFVEILAGIVFGGPMASAESISGLSDVANVCIILILFYIGMKVDLKVVRKNYRSMFSVGFFHMAVTFLLFHNFTKGWYEYYRQINEFRPPIELTSYMVFIAVAMCVTASPMLARMLVQPNLIGDKLGTIVLSSVITNDFTGWILIGLVFTSAFCADIIAVHLIYGAFMVGMLIPKDNGFVVLVNEKLQNIVRIVIIPVYFVIAGLSVNVEDLTHSFDFDWNYAREFMAFAMVARVAGGLMFAKLNGLLWRESSALTILMSCNAIVETMVLNVGLNAEIISPKVYSMFMVITLITTFLTAPLTLLVPTIFQREEPQKLRV